MYNLYMCYTSIVQLTLFHCNRKALKCVHPVHWFGKELIVSYHVTHNHEATCVIHYDDQNGRSNSLFYIQALSIVQLYYINQTTDIKSIILASYHKLNTSLNYIDQNCTCRIIIHNYNNTYKYKYIIDLRLQYPSHTLCVGEG